MQLSWALSEPEMFDNLQYLHEVVFGSETAARTEAEKEQARADALRELKGRCPGALCPLSPLIISRARSALDWIRCI